MPGVATAYDHTKIHVGPGQLWIVDAAPLDAAERLTLTDGTPDTVAHANSIHLGATKSGIVTMITPKNEYIRSDDFEGPVSAFLTEVEAKIEAELMQLDVEKIQKAYGTGTYSTAAGYKQWTFGGGMTLAEKCVAMIAKKRSDPTKFVVACLYRAVGEGGMEINFTRTKEGTYKVTFMGLNDLTRTSGKQMGIFYETI